MEGTQSKKTNLMLPIGIAIVILALVAGGYVYTRNTSMTPTPTPADSMMNSTGNSMMGDRRGMYNDGTYTATGSYTSPGGPEEIGVTLIVKDGIITDSTVEAKATRSESKEYQGIFVENYKSQVVGKSLDSLNLTKVSGSSLTPKGFNDAVEKIKAEAKA